VIKKVLSFEHREKLRLSHLGKKQSLQTIEKRRQKLLGHITSIETRRKISEAHKGARSYNFGKKASQETKLKMSRAHKGFIFSKESKQKMRIAKLGTKISEKQKLQISLAHKGKRLSLEHRQKISQGLIGKNIGKKYGPPSKETRQKQRAKMIGKKSSIKTREKLSILFKGKNSHFYKDGQSYVNETLRFLIARTVKYRLWRERVFKRDKYTCVKCGKTNCYIEADHIKLFSVILRENKIATVKQALLCKELWDINNGQTLCKKCHKSKTKNDLKQKPSNV
jgi:NUMOD3 motif